MTNINDAHATLLAIDTSTPACSVALKHQGKISEKYVAEARKHTQVLLPLIDDLLNDAGIKPLDIDGIMVSAGPGAFTGLRVGASMALGMACANNIDVAPISSLALLAATAGAKHNKEKVLAMMDARMSEIYTGMYVRENGCWVSNGADCVCAPEDLPVQWLDSQPLVAGSGLVYKDRLALADSDYSELLLDEAVYPLAAHLFDFLSQANWQSPAQGIELHYLRNEVTQS